jgi:hypothetical protein
MPNSDLISRSIFLNSFPYYHCLPPAAHPPFCCCRPQRMQAREKIENVCVCTIHCCAGAEELAPVANWIQTNNKRAIVNALMPHTVEIIQKEGTCSVSGSSVPQGRSLYNSM